MFGTLQLALLHLFLFDIGESRQTAAWQVRHEGQRRIVDRHCLPGFHRQSGDAHDIVSGFAWQAGATLQPFDYAVRARIVGGGNKTQIAKLQAQPL